MELEQLKNLYKVKYTFDTHLTRVQGLMYKPELAMDELALFIFQTTSNYYFWNKNVPYDLRLDFFDENGSNVGNLILTKQQLKKVTNLTPFRFVTERKA